MLFFYIVLILSLFLNGVDKENNTSYLQQLFKTYDEATHKDVRIASMQKIFTHLSLNSVQISENWQHTLEQSYQQYGSSIFPCLLSQNNIHYQKSSPQYIALATDIKNLPTLYHQHATISMKKLAKSLCFNITKKGSKEELYKSLMDYDKIKLITQFQDPCWHVFIEASNNYMNETILYSFLKDGTPLYTLVPNGTIDLKKSCVVEGKFYFLTQHEKTAGMNGLKYSILIMQSSGDGCKEIKELRLSNNPHNSLNVTSLTFKGKKIPALVQVTKNITVEPLIEKESTRIVGKSVFSSVSWMSFTNEGRILWIEGCPKNSSVENALIQAWDLEAPKHSKMREWCAPNLVRYFVFSPNGILALGLYNAANNSLLYLCDAFSGRTLITFTVHGLRDYFFWNNAAVCVDCGAKGFFYIDIRAIQYANYYAKKKKYNELYALLKQKADLILANPDAGFKNFELKFK